MLTELFSLHAKPENMLHSPLKFKPEIVFFSPQCGIGRPKFHGQLVLLNFLRN